MPHLQFEINKKLSNESKKKFISFVEESFSKIMHTVHSGGILLGAAMPATPIVQQGQAAARKKIIAKAAAASFGLVVVHGRQLTSAAAGEQRAWLSSRDGISYFILTLQFRSPTCKRNLIFVPVP